MIIMTNIVQNIIRNSMKQIRNQLSEPFQIKSSSHACSKIKRLNEYRYAKHIALYHAIHREISLEVIWNSAPGQGKFCYFPTMKEDKTLLFLPATPLTPFINNRFGIAEPNIPPQEACDPNQLDIIFIPLVAFDKNCHRIGMGGGYYDRTLAEVTKPLLIGVAYEFQLVAHIPVEQWDVPLDAVVTHQHVYWRNA